MSRSSAGARNLCASASSMSSLSCAIQRCLASSGDPKTQRWLAVRQGRGPTRQGSPNRQQFLQKFIDAQVFPGLTFAEQDGIVIEQTKDMLKIRSIDQPSGLRIEGRTRIPRQTRHCRLSCRDGPGAVPSLRLFWSDIDFGMELGGGAKAFDAESQRIGFCQCLIGGSVGPEEPVRTFGSVFWLSARPCASAPGGLANQCEEDVSCLQGVGHAVAQ